MQNKIAIKVLIMILFSVLVMSAWSCASGKNNTRSDTGQTQLLRDRPADPAPAGSAQLSPDLTGTEITLRGTVFMTGNEPHVYTMFASEGKNYGIFPQAAVLELADYQGYTIEVSGLLLDTAKAVPGLLPSDGVIAPRQWKIVQE